MCLVLSLLMLTSCKRMSIPQYETITESTIQNTTESTTETTTVDVTESTTAEPAESTTEAPETESTTEEPTETTTETIPVPHLKPAQPKPVSLTNTTGGILFNWNVVAGATSYRVYKRGAGDRYWTYLATVTNPSYSDSKVASGNYYRYTVIAVNNGGFSTYHSGIVIKRLANPYNIKAANNVNNVTVNWAKINGATAYRVYRRTAGSTYWTYLGTQKNTSFVDTNITHIFYNAKKKRVIFLAVCRLPAHRCRAGRNLCSK